MEILELKVMNGPNYWSATQPNLVVMRIDTSTMENYSSGSLETIIQQMETAVPGLPDLQILRNLAGEPMGSAWAGHALGILALHLQKKAGFENDYYRVSQEGDTSVIQLSFSYSDKEAGRYAAKSAVEILDSLLSLSPVNPEKYLKKLNDLKEVPAPAELQAMIEEARKKNIPYKHLDDGSFIMFGQGANQKKIQVSAFDAGSKMDMLYPHGHSARIPIVGITGTNGKTTTTRLMAHLAKTAGYSVGFTTTDGIYIKDKLISKGDSSGPKSAAIVLGDPAVDFAVLECARGGMLRSGLAFDHCDVAIVTNVAADHLGLKGINSVQDMANVKGVLPKTVFPDGYAILNADDDLVYGMADGLSCNVALFSMDPENPRIIRHRESGGMIATVENDIITVWKGNVRIEIEKVNDIPITFSGRASFMIQNVLAATLAALASDFSLENIKLGLQTFFPGPEQTPGRLNLFKFRDFEVMVDYAHNPHGYIAIKNFLEKMPATYTVGIIAGTGDRRPEDIMEMGRLAAEMFDEIVVRQDKDLRGSTIEHIENCLKKGFEKEGAENITYIPEEKEAVAYVMDNAKPGSFIVICCEYVEEVVALLQTYQKNEKGIVA